MSTPMAFPSWELNGQNKPEMIEQGMELRDWFAGQALQFAWMDINVEGSIKQTAESAYLIADAMMEARKK